MLNKFKDFKDVWIYFYKNWLSLSICMVIPAVLVGFFYNPFKIITFLTNYSKMKVSSFGDIFSSQFGLNDITWLNVLKVILFILLLTVCLSVAFGLIENNMRSGKKNYSMIKDYINNNFLIVLANLVLFALIVFVVKFVLSGIIFALHLAFCGLNVTCNTITYILAIFFCAIALVFILQILIVMILNIPNMISNGYTIGNAISTSITMLEKVNLSLLLIVLLPFVIIIPLICLTSGTIGLNIVVGISTFVLLIYYTCLGMIEYFSLTDTPRYDNRKYYINY